MLLPNNMFKKKKQQIWKPSISIVFIYSKIVLTVDLINMLNRGLNRGLPFKIDITQILLEHFNKPWYRQNFGLAKKLQIPNKIFLEQRKLICPCCASNILFICLSQLSQLSQPSQLSLLSQPHGPVPNYIH